MNVIGMTKMTPPIKDLLPRLTPILKNRFVQVSYVCVFIHIHMYVQVCSYNVYASVCV